MKTNGNSKEYEVILYLYDALSNDFICPVSLGRLKLHRISKVLADYQTNNPNYNIKLFINNENSEKQAI